MQEPVNLHACPAVLLVRTGGAVHAAAKGCKNKKIPCPGASCKKWAALGYCDDWTYQNLPINTHWCPKTCGRCSAGGGTPPRDGGWESEMLASINQQRANFGVPSLCLNSKLIVSGVPFVFRMLFSLLVYLPGLALPCGSLFVSTNHTAALLLGPFIAASC